MEQTQEYHNRRQGGNGSCHTFNGWLTWTGSSRWRYSIINLIPHRRVPRAIYKKIVSVITTKSTETIKDKTLHLIYLNLFLAQPWSTTYRKSMCAPEKAIVTIWRQYTKHTCLLCFLRRKQASKNLIPKNRPWFGNFIKKFLYFCSTFSNDDDTHKLYHHYILSGNCYLSYLIFWVIIPYT